MQVVLGSSERPADVIVYAECSFKAIYDRFVWHNVALEQVIQVATFLPNSFDPW